MVLSQPLLPVQGRQFYTPIRFVTMNKNTKATWKKNKIKCICLLASMRGLQGSEGGWGVRKNIARKRGDIHWIQTFD